MTHKETDLLGSNPAGPGVTDIGCSLCDDPIEEGQMIRDWHVYKCGELDSIELMHTECVENDMLSDALRRTLTARAKQLVSEGETICTGHALSIASSYTDENMCTSDHEFHLEITAGFILRAAAEAN